MKPTHFPKDHEWHCGSKQKLQHTSIIVEDVTCEACEKKRQEANDINEPA